MSREYIACGETNTDGYEWSGYYIYTDGKCFSIDWQFGCSCDGYEDPGKYPLSLFKILKMATDKLDIGPLFLVADPKDDNYSELMECYDNFLEWYRDNYSLKVTGGSK